MSVVILAAVFAFVLAFILGAALGFFSDFFAVAQNPAIDSIRKLLPGINCGGCGFPGCDSFAQAVAEGKSGDAACPVGGPSLAEKISSIISS